MVEVFTKQGTDSEWCKNHIWKTTGFVPAVYDKGTHYVTNMSKSLLTSALIAVVEALRMNPDRYAVIYNSKYDNNNGIFDSSMGTTVAAIASSLSSFSTACWGVSILHVKLAGVGSLLPKVSIALT